MKRYPRETAESKIFDVVFGGLGRLFSRRKAVKSAARSLTATIDRGYVQAEWQKIQEMMQQGGESRFQQAVIMADKLLDSVLRSLVPGETMGDRLKSAQDVFRSKDAYQAAWDGHKLRNRLVHQLNYATVSWEAREAIKDFEIALRDLGIL